MYCPEHFQEHQTAELINLMAQFPLATIICNGINGLSADHIPLLYETAAGTPGRLLGHVAKKNPLWQLTSTQEVLVVFQSPSTYISPNWYASKSENGKVVPTWDYAVVHAYCTLSAIHEPQEILRIITNLTDKHEITQPHPWQVKDAPPEFIEKSLTNIVGFSLQIHRLQGKWKVSQNQPKQNQQSLIKGLQAEASDAQTYVASLIQSHSKK